MRVKNSKLQTLAAGLVMASILVACGESKFSGSTQRKAAVPPPVPAIKDVPLQLACNDSDPDGSTKTVAIKGKRSDRVMIQGEFCPRSYANMNVVFVIDVSGSMQDNDPTLATCGRAQSVKAITDRLLVGTRPQDKINVGVVSFSGAANVTRGLTPIGQFQSSVTTGMLCAASGGTNYAAAMQTTQMMLASLTGPKLVYFITDGEPSMPNSTPQQSEAAGLSAAQSLRSLPELTLNAIFLGSSYPNAQNYLSQVTGAPDRVRLVSNANQMAEEILKFALPEILVVENSVRGVIKIESANQQQDVGIKTFQKISGRTSTWSYQTDPFVLKNTIPNGKTLHRFVITAQDRSGATQTQTVDIDFQALD